MTDKKHQGPLTLQLLKDTGALVPDKPIAAPVEWNEVTLPLYVRRLGAGALDELARAVQTDQRSHAAHILHAAVCYDPDGQELMEFTDAYRLVPALMQKILAEVNRVNGGLSHGS